MSRLISFAVLIAIIIIIGLLFYRVLIGFFIPVFLAAVLVVVFRPLHRWVLARTGHRDRLAAFCSTLLIMLALFLPIGVVAGAATVQGLRLIDQNDASTVLLRINKVRDSLGLEMPSYIDQLRLLKSEIDSIIELTSSSVISQETPELQKIGAKTIVTLGELRTEVTEKDGNRWDDQIEFLMELLSQVGTTQDNEFEASRLAVDIKSSFTQLRTELLGGSFMALARETANPTPEDVQNLTKNALDFVRPKLLSITGATGSFFVSFIFGSVILIVATFFFLYDGPAMINTIMFLSPLDDHYEQELLLEFDRISRAVVLATLLSAITQGLTAGVGYAVAGMDFLMLLVMLTTVFAMVPFVGPAVVWIPVCLYLGLYEERMLAAVLLAVWGVLVVGTVDNLVKAFVLHGQSELHPLLALLSVLGGVQALGPIGIVVGPMAVAMLQTLLSILQRELVQFEGQELILANKQTAAPRSRFRKKKRHRKKANQETPTATVTEPEPNATTDAGDNTNTSKDPSTDHKSES